jgi:hypothetical protein
MDVGDAVAVSVAVAVGDAVAVGVSDGIGDRVKVGGGVSIPPDGWKGVGVGDAFGSCVTKIKVEKPDVAGVGDAQEARRVRNNK